MNKNEIHWWLMQDYGGVEDSFRADYESDKQFITPAICNEHFASIREVIRYMIHYHLTCFIDSIGYKEVEFISSLIDSKDDETVIMGINIINNLK